MRTVIYGKVIENAYEVDTKQKDIKDENGYVKTVYTDKPVVVKKSKVDHWVELYSYDGAPMYNSKLTAIAYFSLGHTINISEDEEVMIDNEIFRADLCEMQLRTNKVVNTIEINEWEAKNDCDFHVREFNEMMIESNEHLKAYCDLHKLVYEETDCIDLFKLVFPNNEYEIVDGVMKVKEGSYISTTDVRTSNFDYNRMINGYLPITGTAISGTINGVTGSTSVRSY